MREVLIDHARTRGRSKRGAGQRLISLEDAGEVGAGREVDLIALDDALNAWSGWTRSNAGSWSYDILRD